MFKTPWEMENLARDRMQQLVAHGRNPLPLKTQALTQDPSRPLARVRRCCGQGLIAAGERLAGSEPRALQPLPTGSVRLG